MLRELEQIQRALDVDLVSRHRREFGSGGQQRGQVEDQLDPEFRQHPFEETAIQDRARDLVVDLVRDRRVEPAHVERDDRTVATLGQTRDQPVANLAAGAGDEHNGFAHARIIVGQRCE